VPIHNPADRAKGSISLDRTLLILDAIKATNDFRSLDILDRPRAKDR
jgi:hypothetical protein